MIKFPSFFLKKTLDEKKKKRKKKKTLDDFLILLLEGTILVFFNPLIFSPGELPHPSDIWQYQETFLVVTNGAEVLLASNW